MSFKNFKLKIHVINLCIVVIRLYQTFFSPVIGDCCRFYPTCSEYAKEAFQKYGVLKGFWLTLRRIIRCHPWHSAEVDPITRE